MALRYVLDEHLRGPLWQAIQQHTAGGLDPLDAVRVGDPPDLPLGTPDPDVLLWAEREGRILVSEDRATMPGHLADHLQGGHHSPGILLIARGATWAKLLSTLTVYAHAGDPALFQDRIDYIP
jgi:hypothetical protein